MILTSPAFLDGAMIPQKYTCDGANISPPLQWGDVPPGTQTLVLILEDPDAPSGIWRHWVVFNLPALTVGLPENVSPAQPSLEQGGQQGTNSWGKVGYGGPCPPGGTHRYYFRLYALDAPLSLTSSATAQDVRAAMEGHLQAETQLMGRYQRRK